MPVWLIWCKQMTVAYFTCQDYLGEDFKSQGSQVAYGGQEFSTQVKFHYPYPILIDNHYQDDLMLNLLSRTSKAWWGVACTCLFAQHFCRCFCTVGLLAPKSCNPSLIMILLLQALQGGYGMEYVTQGSQGVYTGDFITQNSQTSFGHPSAGTDFVSQVWRAYGCEFLTHIVKWTKIPINMSECISLVCWKLYMYLGLFSVSWF